MRTIVAIGFASVLFMSAFPVDSLPPARVATVNLELRAWVRPYPAGGARREAYVEQSFPTANAAIIITDMWDRHWCRGATVRVGEIARKMEPLLQKARVAA